MQNNIKFITIYSDDGTSRLTTSGQPSLLDVLQSCGAAITAPCDGDGRCGRCRVLVRGEVSPPDERELAFPGVGAEDSEGFALRLACRTRLLGDCEIKLMTGDAVHSAQCSTVHSTAHSTAQSAAKRTAHSPAHSAKHSAERSAQRSAKRSAERSANRHKLTGGAGETFSEDVPFGIAVDLGSTTVGMRAVDIRTGATLAQSSRLNDQRVCGADVMTRIAHCDRENGLDTLHRLISCQLTRMMLQMSGGRVPDIITVAGNTVMLHLLANIDPSALGRAPYRTKEYFGRCFSAKQLDLPAAAWLLPCSGGYTGGDLTAALLALTSPAHGGAEERDGLALCDLGTNGEMALLHEGHWLVTSAAAGPALEGGGISCGSGAINGAVAALTRAALSGNEFSDAELSKDAPSGAELSGNELSGNELSDAAPSGDAVSRREGGRYALTSEQDDTVIPVELQVIGDTEPASLTGSALVSLAAILLREGKLCHTGRMEAESWRLNDAVACTQADMRQLQLAKGAVEAAFLRLCEECRGARNNIDKSDCLHIDLHMTGGMGCRIDPADAVEIGLVPGVLGDGITIRFVPDLALEGAVLCLNEQERQRAVDIAQRTRVLELTADDRFDCLFVACMRLGEPDEEYC